MLLEPEPTTLLGKGNELWDLCLSLCRSVPWSEDGFGQPSMDEALPRMRTVSAVLWAGLQTVLSHAPLLESSNSCCHTEPWQGGTGPGAPAAAQGLPRVMGQVSSSAAR